MDKRGRKRERERERERAVNLNEINAADKLVHDNEREEGGGWCLIGVKKSSLD